MKGKPDRYFSIVERKETDVLVILAWDSRRAGSQNPKNNPVEYRVIELA
jgi:hypothetical protein